MKFKDSLKKFKIIISSQEFYIQVFLVVVLVLGINFLASFLPWRWDLTGNKIFSLSSVTEKTLKNLEKEVVVKAYFTEDLPGYLIPVRSRVQDILREYQNWSGSNLKISFLNPNDDPKIEQEAQSLGVPPLKFNVVEEDKYEVAKGYLGLALSYQEDTKVIPVVRDVSNLEYELTLNLKKLIEGQTPTIGLLYDQKGSKLLNQESLSLLEKSLKDQYKTRWLTLDQKIPEEISTLILPGPKGEFSQQKIDRLKNFIEKDKGLLVSINGVEVGPNLQPIKNKSNIVDLLAEYDLKVNQDLIFDPASRGQASFSQGNMQFFTAYGFWPKVQKHGFNQENPLVNKLESLILPWTSSLQGGEVLAATSKDSKKISLDNESKVDLNPQSSPQGQAGGNFPVAVQAKDRRLVAISDGDLLSNGFLNRFSDNRIFVQNIIDGLTWSSSLAQIRSRQITDRPLKKLENSERNLIKYGNIFGVALLIGLIGTLRFVWRRKIQGLTA